MRKAVAVPYIIALILGIAVIALIGIWFVTSGGKFSGQASDTNCQSQQVQYCTQKVASGSAPTTHAWQPNGACANSRYKQPDQTGNPTCDTIITKGPQ